MLQCCLNGARALTDHPGLPADPASAAGAAAAAVQAGAADLHIHPKDGRGRDSLRPDDVAAWVTAVRAAVPGVAVGVTTGAWATREPRRRVEQIAAWHVLPDHASVNLHEPGAVDTALLLLERGVAVEAGVFLGLTAGAAASDAQGLDVLRGSGLSPSVLRVLGEVVDPDPESGPRTAARHLPALTELGLPLLLHGEDGSAWPVLGLAVSLGLHTRVGLEDVLTLPDGTRARDSAALVRAAVEAGAR